MYNMGKLVDYISYSNLIMKVNLNPRYWGFSFSSTNESVADPGLLLYTELKILMLEVVIIIDDGTW